MGDPPLDAWVVCIQRNSAGDRHREFRNAVSELVQSPWVYQALVPSCGAANLWVSMRCILWRTIPDSCNSVRYTMRTIVRENEQARRPPAARKDCAWRGGVGRPSRGFSPAGRKACVT